MDLNSKNKLDNLFNSYQFNIAQKILAARLKRNLTRKQAANKLGMSVVDYTKIEHGQNFEMTKSEYNKILNKFSKS